MAADLTQLEQKAEQGINQYLETARAAGDIDEQSYKQAKANTLPTLKDWLEDENIQRISPNFREGIARAVDAGQWEDLVNAFRRSARFGTGGIRGMMAFDRESIRTMQREGLQAPVLKGPNTINDIVLLRTSAGVAKFGKSQQPPFQKVVIGYDSRIRGQDFAALVAQLFLAFDYTVYFFDEPCPYPEMTFAIPFDQIKADIGILISASHNDYRYNGYKLSCGNGSQFDPEQRNEMYNDHIATVTTADIKLRSFDEAGPDQLVFLGDEEPVEGFDYHGREDKLLNIHREHINHVCSFLMTDNLAAQQEANPLKIAYCAYHGAGRKAVPRLMSDVGFDDVRIITDGGLYDLDGMFPSFCNDPGKEQQPDPGDSRAAKTAVEAYERQFESFADVDILLGTDPDADRCGLVVNVPPEQQAMYGGNSWRLLPADEMWALVLWYRLNREVEKYGKVQDAEKKFIVLSHTTSDAIVKVASKFGLGTVKTWVGFAALAAAVRDVWEGKEVKPIHEGRVDPDQPLCDPFICENIDMQNGQRSINVAAMEQSNGFSILGGPPPDARSLGVDGHVRDKDGVLAALLVAEVAAWAKSQGSTLAELIDAKIFGDPDVGLFVTHYEPDPIDGEYPGIEGDRKKIEILRRALGYLQFGLVGDLEIAGRKVTGGVIYRAGKYDAIYTPTADFQFPDEGVRLYFGDDLNHCTIRPSGTGNSLRFHIQLHDPNPGADVPARKAELMRDAQAIADALRELLKAPRE